MILQEILSLMSDFKHVHTFSILCVKVSAANTDKIFWEKLYLSFEIEHYAESSISIFKESLASIVKIFFSFWSGGGEGWEGT